MDSFVHFVQNKLTMRAVNDPASTLISYIINCSCGLVPERSLHVWMSKIQPKSTGNDFFCLCKQLSEFNVYSYKEVMSVYIPCLYIPKVNKYSKLLKQQNKNIFTKKPMWCFNVKSDQ